MNRIKVVLKVIDAISEWVGRIFSWIIVPLTLLMVFEVFTRRFLGQPTIWTFETTKMLYGAHFMLVAGYALLYKAHVNVDVLYTRLPRKAQLVLDLITYSIFLFLFAAIILWQGTIFAKTSWELKEGTWSVFNPPVYPIKTVVPLTAFLLGLQGVSDFIKRVILLVKGEAL